MLRAALIGFGSSGKTTLFQLMTGAHEAARSGQARGDTSVGISKVPDERLDRLTSMYNPRKRVPATVEFSDLPASGRASGAQTLIDIAAYRNVLVDVAAGTEHALDDGAPVGLTWMLPRSGT